MAALSPPPTIHITTSETTLSEDPTVELLNDQTDVLKIPCNLPSLERTQSSPSVGTVENLTVPRRPSIRRSISNTSSRTTDAIVKRSRWSLHLEAVTWRNLMNIGMYLHTVALPRPPSPTFTRTIPATLSPNKGFIKLQFYCPIGWPNKPRGKDNDTKGFPAMINFHGGGFTIGSATDDCRWADAVRRAVDCILVSVDYRRAPEFPFPTAVEDGVDAIFYIVHLARELKIDINRLSVSGFSAGGNMAFTVPLRWQYECRALMGIPTDVSGGTPLPPDAASEGAFSMSRHGGKIVTICAWYPSLDFTSPRCDRRKTNVRPDKGMPEFFTNLFDASYLYPPKTIDVTSPYLSPGVASDGLLQGLPKDILLYTCEFDELCAEGLRFRDRLQSEPLNKNVAWRMVEGQPHAWDKSPNGKDPERDRFYTEACRKLRGIFYGDEEELAPPE
ncbi:hypothetical protein AOL_s00043g461 [Orbilia oligospora ATCC 24927]|uniref:Alpha/beta hydrolase fold-3 domain-containing protein n=2 Tax=Orbilia oligospora TaxID=2813651 RepID=G1X437_ARTOA|nr:hypothetical protein AOL_s00043g461 [Orbilia oligospora ATCC 24927]EGX52071.1 hypothetical protein AOL_s00043g461 [Orbilia oligospora ATCC 24927]KAF3289561.1 hypothetical protein TWF970_003332 [Orbilia oligospora]